MTINVHNGGASDASAVVVRAMDVTDTPAQVGDDVTIPTIATGQTMSVTLVYDTSDKSGNRTLTVSADPDNSITESNENDNTSTVTIPITASSATSSAGEQIIGVGAAAEPTQPAEPEVDDEASVDDAEPRAEPQAPGLNVELAEDLDLRD